jgi:hypothetical protein
VLLYAVLSNGRWSVRYSCRTKQAVRLGMSEASLLWHTEIPRGNYSDFFYFQPSRASASAPLSHLYIRTGHHHCRAGAAASGHHHRSLSSLKATTTASSPSFSSFPSFSPACFAAFLFVKRLLPLSSRGALLLAKVK